MTSGSLFLDTLDGMVSRGPPPVWLMRQAGRYLPEYREIRATAASFLEFCYTPRLAVEATLQPIRRFGFDAAILFSDILVVPDALGQAVSFESGHGPRLEPIGDADGLARLTSVIDLGRLAPVFETIATLKARLPSGTPLIGFCGAPWTVASYMVAGRGTPDQAAARLLAYRDPGLFGRVIDLLVDASVDYLDRQFAAGVDAVQVFDSWAGVLPAPDYAAWCMAPLRRIVGGLRSRRPEARIIGFPRVAGAGLLKAVETGVSALSLDTAVDPTWADAALPRGTPVQGNLDPLVLMAGGAALDAAVDRIRGSFAGRPHVLNLGHGILPETPVAHVEQMLARVRR